MRSDHGGEFQNELFEKFCEENGIMHNFSAPRTSQQNEVVERKNRSLEELACTCWTNMKCLNIIGLMLWAQLVMY